MRLSRVEMSITNAVDEGGRIVATIASEGWDIRAELGNGDVVVKHCKDWDGVERLRAHLRAEQRERQAA